ncbi:MAG: ABC transporter permease [Clostridia bacterium]|nr:ABC transporter permease [Clostridia bacterium]
MRHITKGQVFLLILSASVLVWCFLAIDAIPKQLQYIFTAPAPTTEVTGETVRTTNRTLTDMTARLADSAENWEGVIRSYSLDGIVEKATVTGDTSVQARLTLLGAQGEALRNLIPRFGRLIYPEELTDGDRVILLDEGLALSLFRIADPIDRMVNLGGETYRVIGILRHTRQVGDSLDYAAYIPLSAIVKDDYALDAVLISAAPIPGTGAGVMFQSTLTNLFPGGTFIDLEKEQMGAWLWLRVLLFLAGIVLLLRLSRILVGRVLLSVKKLRERLKERYALQLLPGIVGTVLLYIVCIAMIAGLFVLLMNLILAPVYVFPEWVPAVLVEWADIQDAFWKVWKSFAVMHEMRTSELMRLRFLTLLVDGFSALAGVVFFSIYRRFRTHTETVAESLLGMYHLGCAELTLKTGRTLEFEEMGFVSPGETSSGDNRMIRIVSVERTLAMIPGSRKEGTFVLEVTDTTVPQNNVRLEIVCDGKTNVIRPTRRDWDIQMTVEALTRLLYGQQNLHDFLETQSGCELHVRSEAMDGFFAHHLGQATLR